MQVTHSRSLSLTPNTVNRPPSGNNRGLAVGSVVNSGVMGARGTALQAQSIPEAVGTRGAFNLNVHGTTGKQLT